MSDSESPASGASQGDHDTAAGPLLRVVNPDATPEEVAALVAVLAALGSVGGEPPRRRTPEWSAPHRGVRRTHLSGPGGWRSSGLAR
ncbi:acyl-CoA carboxylase epsilon subunit [Nocardioides sp. Soil777]|uniref:acyl-CoA carboxylase epsilon subunit n=1 Tax=Nocardioides sp. Soil777 TaxID=1736409 RepID=UPI0009ECB841|nr:acyl-CoA carboxylase epsilon subunit [Nocardioides sp. Soil777]